MKKILEKINSALGRDIVKAITALSMMLANLVDFLKIKNTQTQQKEQKKELKDARSKESKIADEGSISDLLDLRPILTIMLLLTCGCSTQTIVVDPVKTWEGHFYSIQEAQNALDRKQLEKNESIWIISNRTLKRVLENNRK